MTFYMWTMVAVLALSVAGGLIQLGSKEPFYKSQLMICCDLIANTALAIWGLVILFKA